MSVQRVVGGQFESRGTSLPAATSGAQPSAAPAVQALCIQPRAERSGRLVRKDGALVRCGKPAAWTCSTCSDPLCEPCAHAWGHFPRRAA